MKIKISDINYVTNAGRKVILATSTGRYEYYEKFVNVTEVLQYHPDFCRPLKYTMINLARISSADGQKVVFDNGDEFYLGRDSGIILRNIFLNYSIKENKKTARYFKRRE